jgi:hypothetical protein
LLAKALALLIDLVSINQTTQADGVLIKRRRWGRGALIGLGNVYLHVSHSRIQMFVSTAAWQAWECESYRRLYGGGCERLGAAALRIIPLPGQSLLTHLQSQTLTPAMMVAAAHELRRAHALGWTHGDPHLANILYDGTRAFLIDFETQHLASLSFTARCADDLLVLLLDLMGRSDVWAELSAALLSSYGDGQVLTALIARLHVPRAFERVLWASRTQYLPQRDLVQRVAKLRGMVGERVSLSSRSI